MSVTSPGSRAVDDRRRRRLAVSGDAPGTDSSEGETASTTAFRERAAEATSASPWLPLAMWQRAVLLIGFWSLLIGLGTFAALPHVIPAPLCRICLPLVIGPSAKLVGFVDIVLRLLAAEFAAIVGWYRSHSLLDFSGRYRVWGWIAVAWALASFLAATSLHLLLADAYAERLTWLTWRQETLAWLVPLTVAGLVTVWLADRDIRRCVSSLILVRLAAVAGLALSAGVVYTPELQCEVWFAPAMLAGRWVGLGLLVTGMWRHANFVAYTCPDPPEKRAARTWLGFIMAGFVALAARWWIPSAAVAADAAPKRGRRRKKTEAEGEDEESSAPKRRRKPAAAKSKRASKPRTRSKPEPEQEEGYESEEESAAVEDWDTTEQESANSSATQDWNEDDLEQLEALTRPDNTASAAANGKPSNSAGSSGNPRETDDSGDDDDDYGGVDGAHGQSDMYKGLSKRQRRELKKKQREMERDGRGRT